MSLILMGWLGAKTLERREICRSGTLRERVSTSPKINDTDHYCSVSLVLGGYLSCRLGVAIAKPNI
jgi:hypothetical protein